MNKYQKLLVSCVLVSFPLITPAIAVDFNYRINEFNIKFTNVSLDALSGINFDSVVINGQSFTSKEILAHANLIQEIDPNKEIRAFGLNRTAGEVQEALAIFQGAFKVDTVAQINEDLEARGVSMQSELTQGLLQYTSERSSLVRAGKPNTTPAQLFAEMQKVVVPMTYSATVQTTDIVDTRTDMIDSVERLASNQGISAGDMGLDLKHGIWIKGSISNDRYNKKIVGHKIDINTTGLVGGYDVKINDNILIGLGFGYQQSKLYRDLKLSSQVGVAYGRYNFEIPVFIDGKYSYSSSVFTGKDKRSEVVLMALGLNNFHGYQAAVGYNYALMDNAELTPSIGLKHVVHDWKLPKKTLLKTFRFKTKKGRATYATFGLKLKGLIAREFCDFMPYVSAGLDKRLNQRRTKLILTNVRNRQSTTLPVDVAEPTKLNLGTGVTAKINEMFSTSLGYKYTKTKLYQSHGGTLGFRLDF